MNHFSKENESVANSSGLHLKNPEKNAELVILFPITRLDENSVSRWLQLIETVNASRVFAIVVINKTGKKSVNEFFTLRMHKIRSQVFILERKPSESIFDSQKFITLDDFLWIQQFHDDDNWEGSINIPEDANPNDIYYVDFWANRKSWHGTQTMRQNLPAQIIFSAIPAQLWNRFSEFIYAQGENVAGSQDFTLDRIAKLGFNLKSQIGFKYYYFNHHWRSGLQSRRHLKSICKEAGWGNIASAEVALINRLVDSLAAISFFETSASKNDLKVASKDLMDSIKPRVIKRIYFELTLALFSNVLLIARKVKLQKFERTNRIFVQLVNAKFRREIILKFWKVTTLGELITYLNYMLSEFALSKVSQRINFWITEVKQLEMKLSD